MFKQSMYNNLLSNGEGEVEIYNSMTKAKIVVEEKDYIDKILLNNTDNQAFEILAENGFIVDKDMDEVNALRYAYNKRYFSSTALGLILLPTMACNFECPYCFEKPSAHLVENENVNYFKIVEKYLSKEAPNFRHVNLNFFGGEPLLKRNQMDNFTKRVQALSEKLKFSVGATIVTNGSLINESVMESLLRVNCNLIQITIDGAKHQHDQYRIFKTGAPSFDILIEKIKFVASYVTTNSNLRVLVRFNLNSTSLKDVENTLSLFNPNIRKYISLLFRPVYETKKYHESNSNRYDELNCFNELGHQMGFVIYKNRRTYLSCEACGDTNVIHILPDLSLWKCVNDLSFEEAKIGHLRETGEAEWDAKRVLAWYRYSDFLQDEKCRGCSMSPDCLGGCIRNHILTGKHRCGSLVAFSSPYQY